MTHADKIARQHEDNKAQLREGARVNAIYRPTGARGWYKAIKLNEKLLMRREDGKLWCHVNQLVLLTVERRGFEGK